MQKKFKIIIFAPHPDDELVGAGGSILKWKDDGHDIHIIYISDGRAAYTYEREMGRLIESEVGETQISEEELANVRMKEIDEVAKFLKLPKSNIYKFKIPDQDVKSHIKEGIEMSKDIIKEANRIVLPSNNNIHEDHQATYDIATGVAKELNLVNTEFYGYSNYVRNKPPNEKKVIINVTEYRDKVYDALRLYKSQRFIIPVSMAYDLVKTRKRERFGVYQLSDIGKFYNF